MKELSIEEKAKRYDETIEMANSLLIGKQFDNVWIYRLLPELLQEDSDERIAKDIIAYIRYERKSTTGEIENRFIPWLEKQGGQKETLCDKCRKEQPSHSCQDITELGRCYVEHNQKSVDKVEPKFNVGDWVVCCDYEPEQIIGIRNNMYEMSNGDIRPINMVNNNHNIRLWTIKEALDGDVLEFEDHERVVVGIVSFVNVKTGKVDVSCLLEDNKFKIGNFYALDTIKPHPATTEQRDLLFSKMKEAGYKWDAEKKELKKIEQKPAWSGEDIEMLNSAISFVEHSINLSSGGNGKYNVLSWLKSLRTQNQWKPSEEQIDAFEHFVRGLGESGYASPYDNNTKSIYSLLEQLKAL